MLTTCRQSLLLRAVHAAGHWVTGCTPRLTQWAAAQHRGRTGWPPAGGPLWPVPCSSRQTGMQSAHAAQGLRGSVSAAGQGGQGWGGPVDTSKEHSS